MDMTAWLRELMEQPVKKAFPVLSFPSVSLLGCTVAELIADPERIAEGMVRVAERCDTAAAVSMMDLSVEAEAFGSKIHISDDEVPTVVGAIAGTPELAEALAVPEVGAGRTGRCVEAIRLAAERITDRPVFAGVIGPFSLAGRLIDVSEIMINCYDEPEMVHCVMRKATDFLIEYIRAYRAAGAHGVMMAEPLTGLLSPALAEEFSEPYVREIVEAVQDDGFLLIYHNCGNNTVRMLPSILRVGAAAYHFGNAVSMEDVLAGVPEDTVVMGNLDPAALFRNGTPEEVRRETKALLDACGGKRNFIPSSGCDIPPASRWENIDAFFEAVTAWYA